MTTLIVAELVFFLMPILGAFTWIAGLVTLVVSRYWTASEKLRGFLALGTGYPIVFFVVGWLGLPGISTSGSASCSSSSVTTERGEVFEGGTRCVETGGGVHWSGVVVLVLLAAYLVLQVITARRLLRSRG